MNIVLAVLCAGSVAFMLWFLVALVKEKQDFGAPATEGLSRQSGITPPGGNNGNPGATIPGFAPDLRKTEDRGTMAILVKF